MKIAESPGFSRGEFVKIYGFKLNCSQGERVSVTMKVAVGKMSAEEFLAWLKSKIN